ncbi:MAG: transposase [Balneola sp.]|nr:transposase [Balneola sp.]
MYQINGVEDHIHILTHIHPSVALSQLVKDIKLASSFYIKENKLFFGFHGWQEGYGAFTYSLKEKERLINYVKNQEEHHKKLPFVMSICLFLMSLRLILKKNTCFKLVSIK